MGTYNTVLVPCPDCGRKNELQSKGGTRDFSEKKVDEAAISDLAAIEGDPINCELCGTTYYILLKCLVKIRKAHRHYQFARETDGIHKMFNNEIL